MERSVKLRPKRSQDEARLHSRPSTAAARIADLEIFERVVTTGSMSAVARELKVSAACVSSRIRRLEARVGAKLLHRTTRELWLTAAGESLYGRAVRILATVHEAEVSMFSLLKDPEGAVVKAAQAGWCPPGMQPLGRWVLGEFKSGSGLLLLAPAYCTAMGRWVRASSTEGCPTVLGQIPERWCNFGDGTGEEQVAEGHKAGRRAGSPNPAANRAKTSTTKRKSDTNPGSIGASQERG